MTPPIAPILNLFSSSSGLITLSWDIDDTVTTGDALTRQAQASGGDWSSLLDNTSHVITSGEDSANRITASQLLFASNGTYDIRGCITRSADGSIGAWSNTLTVAISDIATNRILWGSDQIVWGVDRILWS